MNERIKFIALYLERAESITDLCSRFSVSRKTGYKWIERYRSGGVAGLADQSRAHHTHPRAVSDNVVRAILSARQKHPRWGPRKLLIVVKRQNPRLRLPVPSTVGDILKRNGLIKPRRRRRRSDPFRNDLTTYDRPNAVWCADFKGQFPVGGRYCYPLTISDGFSRYLLVCHALYGPKEVASRKVFERAFREYGLPDAIRTDNGTPFSSLAPAGLSRLAVWWIRLGIRPERIRPGHPEENGRHERMHLTLKQETAQPPKESFRTQQKVFDAFRREYNEIRPHEALAQEVPSSKYHSSTKPYPEELPELEYPSHFKIVRAPSNGVLKFRSRRWLISSCLGNQRLGLEEVGDGRWKVHFGPISLGILDLRSAKTTATLSHLVRLDGGWPNNDGRIRAKKCYP